ncbi:MAG: PEGA domain-containing protein [bacterium]
MTRTGWIKVVVCLILVVSVVWAEKVCPICGTINRDDAKFCKKCGAKLPEPQPRPSLPRLRVDVTVRGNSATITSSPSGATVWIDGVEQGNTPLELKDLSSGRHELEVRLPGYSVYHSGFNITAQEATLVVTSDPVGAEVWVDGVYKGKTTETGLVINRVAHGARSISARLAGYEEATKLIEVNKTGPIGVFIKLGIGKGFLSVETKPSGAMVFANGRKIGVSDLLVGLAPDRYALVLSKPGYEDWLGYAQVVVDDTVYVSQSLSRLPRRQLPLLLAGVAFLAGGAGMGIIGEKSYKEYQEAGSTEEAINYRRQTERWDILRNIGLGLGAAGIGAYLTVRW